MVATKRGVGYDILIQSMTHDPSEVGGWWEPRWVPSSCRSFCAHRRHLTIVTVGILACCLSYSPHWPSLDSGGFAYVGVVGFGAWELGSTGLVLMPDRNLTIWALPTLSLRKLVPPPCTKAYCLSPS